MRQFLLIILQARCPSFIKVGGNSEPTRANRAIQESDSALRRSAAVPRYCHPVCRVPSSTQILDQSPQASRSIQDTVPPNIDSADQPWRSSLRGLTTVERGWPSRELGSSITANPPDKRGRPCTTNESSGLHSPVFGQQMKLPFRLAGTQRCKGNILSTDTMPQGVPAAQSSQNVAFTSGYSLNDGSSAVGGAVGGPKGGFAVHQGDASHPTCG